MLGAIYSRRVLTPARLGRRCRSFATGTDRATVASVSAEELAVLNRTSVRLYRILLRQCGSAEPSVPILLQPPIDPRDYGRARLVRTPTHRLASAGAGTEDIDIDIDIDLDLDIEQDEIVVRSIFSFLSRITGDSGIQFAADAVRRYRARSSANSLDIHDVERDVDDSYDTDSSGDDDDDDDEEDQDEQHVDQCLLVTPEDIRLAVQASFLRHGSSLTKEDVVTMQRHAIDAIRILGEQEKINARTSVSFDHARHVRIVATSSCIGTTAMAALETKYRFAYRIRVENTLTPPSRPNNHQKPSSSFTDSTKDPTSVQLLGRTWHIQEDGDGEQEGEIVTVNAPSTGAVGHLPVIRPGEVFEYMSGCELGTKTGSMSGSLHMVSVPDDTHSAKVGDYSTITAMQLAEDNFFCIPVNPFALVATDHDTRTPPRI
eukprot:scaffold126150_cov60-Attheya_sp.AAC.17